MKTVDLSKEQHSLSEMLVLARSEAVLIRSDSGEDFVLEHADVLDREAATLGSSDAFLSFLEARSHELGDIPIDKVRDRRGI
jgi:hypothetical protein